MPKEIAGNGPRDDDNQVEETTVSESQVDHSRTTTRLVSAWLQHRSSPYPDLADKITEKHIDKALDIADGQSKRIAADRRHSRKFMIWMSLICGVFGLILVAMMVFSGNAVLMRDIIEWLAAGSLGWAGGYGWAKRKS